MLLQNVTVHNYKCLQDVYCPLSQFVCAVGENNAGKSSLLQALLLLIEGQKLTRAEFFDDSEDVLITATLVDISEQDLDQLGDHREDIARHVENGKLVLARRYLQDGTSRLRLVTQVPIESRFQDAQIEANFKQKRSTQVDHVLKTIYPEVHRRITTGTITTQTSAKEAIQAYLGTLSAEHFETRDTALPTGIDNSIRNLFPEPVYIPAVKDFSDDLKTKESASFGKLLKILLNVIEDDFSDAAATFEKLRRKLNKYESEDGTVVDDRIGKVREIEGALQDNLRQTFRNVEIELRIPPPEIKAILGSATIFADDGYPGPIESKGDGFKRAVAFSILRTYAQLSQDGTWRRATERRIASRNRFLFLFEEPELYLHPQAQNVLFEALAVIAERHQVVVTTHSPLFFSANATRTFVKVSKEVALARQKPASRLTPVDLTEIGEKDRFQLINYETSNHAFFARRILLVEGDSELIVLPHIASLLNSKWDFKTTSTTIVKSNGKGSFRRYRDFFSRFGIEVVLVADLDVLVNGFTHLDPNPEERRLHSDLLQAIDRVIENSNLPDALTARKIKKQLERNDSRTLYQQLVEARHNRNVDRQVELLDAIFAFEKQEPRLVVLRNASDQEVGEIKSRLLASLRERGVCVWERGDIEAYYPEGLEHSDKPSHAQAFCSAVTSADVLRGLFGAATQEATSPCEFEIVLGRIFHQTA